MNILAAILILTSTGQASRETTVQVGIERVLVGVIAGGVKDGLSRGGFLRADSFELGQAKKRIAEARIRLVIDGTERTGWGWGEAAYRVASYATDRRTDGSVGYVYRLRIQGFDIRRSTRIENGSVVLTTDVWGSIGPKGELYRVNLKISAVETSDGTRIMGYATGYSHIGDRCRLVERVAERVISRELAAVLRRIEDEGRGLYASGDIHSLGTALIERLTR